MLGNLGRMPLQGHLISVARPHLCLLIIWKVRTLSLSKNLIPKMKATPSGPYQMPGPQPGHGCGVDRSRPLPSGGHAHQLERQSGGHSEESPSPLFWGSCLDLVGLHWKLSRGPGDRQNQPRGMEIREPRALVLSSYFVSQFLILSLYCVNSANRCLQPQTLSVLWG